MLIVTIGLVSRWWHTAVASSGSGFAIYLASHGAWWSEVEVSGSLWEAAHCDTVVFSFPKPHNYHSNLLQLVVQ